jgi:hypothetical protein
LNHPCISKGLRRADSGRVSALAAIPEEEIWLSKQKSARTRRAYRLDVTHFMHTLSIATPEELRQADHKAVIAWERYMREDDPPASRGAVVALQAPGAAQPCVAEPGRRGSRPGGDRIDRDRSSL